MSNTSPVQVFGVRLRQARAMRGLSLRELAQAIDGKASHTLLAQYEKGQGLPGSEVLVALSQALGQGLDFFFRPASVRLEGIDFRKKSRLGKKEIEKIRETASDRIERYLELEELCGERSTFHSPLKKHLVSSYDGLEKLADELRSAWKLGKGPLSGVLDLLEQNGVKVHLLDGPEDFFGLSGWTGKIPVVVLNRNQPPDRLRLTALHELGHLVLELSDDLDEESACHRFAGAILFPAEACRSELHGHRHRFSVPELLLLKRRWGISLAAIAKRAEQLGIVTKDTYVAFVKRMGVSGWRRTEPGEVAPECVSRFDRLLYLALAEGFVTLSKASELSGRTLDDLHGRLQGL